MDHDSLSPEGHGVLVFISFASGVIMCGLGIAMCARVTAVTNWFTQAGAIRCSSAAVDCRWLYNRFVSHSE